MDQFYGTHRNRIDAKGRVSIPASFRAILRNGSDTPAVILRPSHRHACIEGWLPATYRSLMKPEGEIRPFDADQEDDDLTLFGDAEPPAIDKEGRIVLPPALATYAGITDEMSFVGMGRYFQIWEPAALERRRSVARANSLARHGTAAMAK